MYEMESLSRIPRTERHVNHRTSSDQVFVLQRIRRCNVRAENEHVHALDSKSKTESVALESIRNARFGIALLPNDCVVQERYKLHTKTVNALQRRKLTFECSRRCYHTIASGQ